MTTSIRMWAVIVLLIAAAAAPIPLAEAAEPFPAGSPISTVAPTHGEHRTWEFQSSGKTFNRLEMWMYWNTARRHSALAQTDDAYEHEAVFKTTYTKACWPGWYHTSWESNLPAPYQDTSFDDDETVVQSRAGGSGKSALLQTAAWYYFWTTLNRFDPCVDAYDSRHVDFKAKIQDSHIGDGLSGETSCVLYGYEWCVFGDPGYPRDIVPFSAGWTTPGNYAWAYNQLPNPSFEGGITGWQTYSSNPASVTLYQSSSSSLEGSRYLNMRCTYAPDCAILTDVPFNTLSTDIFFVEYGLRCPSGQSDCSVRAILQGFEGTTSEGVSNTHTVPADGRWYLGRFGVTDFALRSKLRLSIHNLTISSSVDVDFLTLLWSDKF